MQYTLPVLKLNVSTPHVEYSYYSPEPKKGMQRFRPTFGSGRIKDPVEKEEFLRDKAYELLNKLEQGFNPFLHKYDQYHVTVQAPRIRGLNIIKALNLICDIKKDRQKKKGFKSYRSVKNQFVDWLEKRDLNNRMVHEITKGDILAYLRFKEETEKIGLRTRFNQLTILSTLFKEISGEEITPEPFINPCNGIDRKRRLAAKKTARTIYSTQQVQYIRSWCDENDQYLLTFIRFIIYAFLRPETIINLRVEMVDPYKWEINMPGEIMKPGEGDRRIIQKILRPTIEGMKLESYPGGYFLFGRDGVPSYNGVSDKFFANRFRPLKKLMGLDRRHDMYSLRHTFATDLVRSGQPWFKIMKVTGHKSLSSFEAYVKSIMAEEAEDLSASYSIAF